MRAMRRVIKRSFFAVISFLIVCHSVQSYNPPQSALVVEAETGKILHQQSARQQRHPASLTKKMTLFLLFEALQKKQIQPDTLFYVSKNATLQAPSKLGLQEGRYITVFNVIKALITKSANDMAVVAAEGLCGTVPAFVSKMNETAKRLGMHQTIFKNPTGLPDANQWSTAYDMYVLAKALYEKFPTYWKFFKLKNFSYQGKTYRNHNKLLISYPSSDGIKTGYIHASGFNISTSAKRYTSSGRPIRLFVVVMGGKTSYSRDHTVKNLFDRYFSYLGATHTKKPGTTSQSDDELLESIPVNALAPYELKDQRYDPLEAVLSDGLLSPSPKALKPRLKKVKLARRSTISGTKKTMKKKRIKFTKQRVYKKKLSTC